MSERSRVLFSGPATVVVRPSYTISVDRKILPFAEYRRVVTLAAFDELDAIQKSLKQYSITEPTSPEELEPFVTNPVVYLEQLNVLEDNRSMYLSAQLEPILRRINALRVVLLSLKKNSEKI